MWPHPPFDPDWVPQDFIDECERMGAFKRERELILEITDEWNDGEVEGLIEALRERHDLNEEEKEQKDPLNPVGLCKICGDEIERNQEYEEVEDGIFVHKKCQKLGVGGEKLE